MDTLGAKFKAARLKRKLTASEAAKGTRIKIQHIEAMERDDFSAIPAVTYAKGFIRIYADYLELDSGPLVDEYMERHAPKEKAPLLPDENQPSRSASDKKSGGSAAWTPKLPRPQFKWPAWAKIDWRKIQWPAWLSLEGMKRLVAKRPSVKWPEIELQQALKVSAIIMLVLIVWLIARRDPLPQPETSPVAEQTVAESSRTAERPAAATERLRPRQPLPLIDALPEPYLDK